MILLLPGCETDRFFSKCDETRPQCTKCSTYRVWCNYDPAAPDLQLSFQEPKKWDVGACKELAVCKVQASLGPILKPYAISADGTTSFELDGQCMNQLDRFRYRTMFTLGGPHLVQIFEKESLKMAYAVCLRPKDHSADFVSLHHHYS